MKFFPGLRVGDGSIITRIIRRKHDRGWVYPEGVDPDSTEASKIKPTSVYKIRADMEPPSEHKWFIVQPFSEVWVGWWDGETVVNWDDAQKKYDEKQACENCGAETHRWCHLTNGPVCWDCCDKKKYRDIAKAAYAKPEHVT